ncbi:MAG: HepT-like ribonuclease domain-containing protein [Promethearchaeia archaeon]
MDKYALFIVWIPGLPFGSITPLLLTLFNHLYVWVHYFTLEEPDFQMLHKNENFPPITEEWIAELDIISEDTAEKGVSMIKMRNIIAHEYAKIDYTLLMEGLRDLREDFVEIQNQVIKWIELQEKKDALD